MCTLAEYPRIWAEPIASIRNRQSVFVGRIDQTGRRIGLLNNVEVPLNAGLKVNGREHSTNFGALIVRTGDSDEPAIDSLPTANTPVAAAYSQTSVIGFASALAPA